MDQPLVSIVISVYRRTAFLPQAIRSALDQTWPSVEIIVTEDGGSDCAAPLVRSFAQPESRLRLIHHERNIGAAANKLAAWRRARGDFIVNLDDDDLLEPVFVERLLPPLITNPTLVLSFCDHAIIDAQGVVDEPATTANTRLWRRDTLQPGPHRPFHELGLVHQCIPFAMGCLWCRSRMDLDLFSPQAGPSYDLFMTYVAAHTGLGACYVPERLTRYRVHAQMETSVGRERIHRANIFCNSVFMADPDLQSWRFIFRDRLVQALTGLGIVLLRNGHRVGAMRAFAAALRQRPTRRALAGLVYSSLPSGPKRLF